MIHRGSLSQSQTHLKAVRRRAKERGKPEPEPTADGKLRATTVQGWKRALNQLAAAYPDRIPTH